uniref:Glycosyltransferase family 92 protein n=1 Tax=Panagrolaimus superbus TaxID=310955 RepID=A0A914YZ03_9BILA
MQQLPRIFLYLILISASVLFLYFSNISYSINLTSWDSTNFDTHLFLSPEPLVQIWNKNNSTDKFCVWFNFTKAIQISSNLSISLCTHGSIGYSKFIFDHAKHWSDLISVSFILDENGFSALQAFQKLHQCIPEAAEKISAHLVWRMPLNDGECSASFIIKGLSNLSSDSEPFNCDLETHIEAGRFEHSLSSPYPPNSLRNIARRGASTNLHLIADIENHFSLNASEILSISAAKSINKNDKVAVIVRRFEYNDTFFEPPRTIYELNELMENNQAFEFHHFLYAVGHRIPGLNNWLNYSLSADTVPNLTPITYQGNVWEPQLIVHSSYPYHFEGFPIRIHDQQALPYELCRAGYSFAVASHVFSFHKGIKLSPSTKESAARKAVAKMASETGKKFRAYLDKKYSKIKSKNCKDWK